MTSFKDLVAQAKSSTFQFRLIEVKEGWAKIQTIKTGKIWESPLSRLDVTDENADGTEFNLTFDTPLSPFKG